MNAVRVKLMQIRLKRVCAFHNRKLYRFGTRIVVNCYTTRQYYNTQTLQAFTCVSIGALYYYNINDYNVHINYNYILRVTKLQSAIFKE